MQLLRSTTVHCIRQQIAGNPEVPAATAGISVDFRAYGMFPPPLRRFATH